MKVRIAKKNICTEWSLHFIYVHDQDGGKVGTLSRYFDDHDKRLWRWASQTFAGSLAEWKAYQSEPMPIKQALAAIYVVYRLRNRA